MGLVVRGEMPNDDRLAANVDATTFHASTRGQASEGIAAGVVRVAKNRPAAVAAR
jgi:hypothetical protein